ncbi:MAG: hypothetical protein AAFO84_10640 [Cyanobacteria bacterium J06598_1]
MMITILVSLIVVGWVAAVISELPTYFLGEQPKSFEAIMIPANDSSVNSANRVVTYGGRTSSKR